ncbi:MAG: acyl-CoA dehydrogenase family protein [Rubrobacter sp.]|nr:acyl-CoA dehydrogenase family protein [Rubrobacter sp.]
MIARSLPAGLVELRESVVDFVDGSLRPIVEEYEARQRFPLEMAPRMGELGCFAAGFPEEAGGLGLGRVGQSAVIQELARASGGISTTTLVQFLSLFPIARHGTSDQKERYLSPGLRGRKMASIAVTEPNHGSDVAGIETTAVKDGDGYLLSGTKQFISNGPFADFMVVAAKTDPSAGHRGISMFVVDRDNLGLGISEHLKKMGWWSAETATVYLEDCRVQESAVVGEVGRGFYYIMEDFDFEHLLLAAQSVGLAEEALDLAVRYARQREQFGQQIGKHQAIRHKLAIMATNVEAGRRMLYDAVARKDEGEEVIKESAMTKYFCSEMVNRVAYDAMQVLGGAGFAWHTPDYPVERIYRDARVLTIGGGTSEIQLNIIAKQLDL